MSEKHNTDGSFKWEDYLLLLVSFRFPLVMPLESYTTNFRTISIHSLLKREAKTPAGKLAGWININSTIINNSSNEICTTDIDVIYVWQWHNYTVSILYLHVIYINKMTTNHISQHKKHTHWWHQMQPCTKNTIPNSPEQPLVKSVDLLQCPCRWLCHPNWKCKTCQWKKVMGEETSE